jgi:restriction system protein
LLSTLITVLVAGGAICAGLRFGGAGGWALAGAGVVVLAARALAWVASRRRRFPALAAVDAMDGRQFEAFVADLLEQQGWKVEATPGSGDLGVDLVAEEAERRWAIQVKRQAAPVTRRAVSDAVAGRDHYGCTDAMVVTNSVFTRGAEALAASTGCELVDLEELSSWIRAR